jgi:hypothetical protein
MLYREIIAVCSETHTKHINTLCGQNVELLSVKHGGTYSNQWALKGWIKSNIQDPSQYSCTYEHMSLAGRHSVHISLYDPAKPLHISVLETIYRPLNDTPTKGHLC